MLSLMVNGLVLSLHISMVMFIGLVYLTYDLAVITRWLRQLGAWKLQPRRRTAGGR